MKRFELTLTFLQLPLDYIMLVLAGITAYYLRFTRPILDVRPVVFKLPWETYLATVLGVALLWIVIFAISGLYSTNPNRKFARDLGKIFLACSTGFAGITIYIFFSLQKFDSRFLVLASWITAIIYVTLGRLAMRGVKSLLYRAGINLRRTIIIGTTPIAQSLTETFKLERRLGYLIVGIFDRFTPENKEKIALLKPDELIITDPKAHPEEVLAAVDFANDEHIVFKYTADLFATIASNISISTIAGIPIIEVRRTRLFGWGGIVKRFADIIGSVILIILSLPIYLITSIAILIETGRPIIYKNERVGQHGKRFHVYKFRSMYQKDCTGDQFGTSGEKALEKEAELIKKSSIKEGPVYKIKDDPRITPLGHFLRRTSIDELPQFFNVLRGEMSLVGPRPHQPREVEHYQKQHRIVLVVKPGITGLAQISGRSNLSFEEEIKLDTLYIEQWSLLTDCIIIFKTPFVIVKKEGVL
jgi:exopolysaccharide biosynthesis polyprenyl glycosylphosphotransferase